MTSKYRNRDRLDNDYANLKEATYDEYHTYMEQGMLDDKKQRQPQQQPQQHDLEGELEVKINDMIIKPTLDAQGYEKCTLGPLHAFVHRMVNHRNKNREDNRVASLEWTTPKDNLAHAHGHPVLVSDVRDGKTYYYPSMMDASRILGISRGSLTEMAKQEALYNGYLKFTPGKVYESVTEMYENENVRGMPEFTTT